MIEDGDQSPLISRITSIRRDVSRAMGFVHQVCASVMTIVVPMYRIRIGQAIVVEDSVYPDRKLALPGGLSQRKLQGIEGKDPSFGMDAIWIQPHQQAEAEADDYVVVEPDSVIATHLSQVLYKHGYDLLGPDDVQTLLANLERTSPTLVENVVPKLVPLHTLTSILRHLLSDRIPISDMRRILEGVSELVTQNLSPQDTAEALRPALAPLLIQQVAPLNAPLPLITLAPELEQLLMRTRQQNPNEPLVLEPQLAQTILGALSQVTEDMASSGRTALVVVSAQLRVLRRLFARAQQRYNRACHQ